MGLYLSAHPLDKYDTYFEEQTHPITMISAENDGRAVVIGGIITAVRTILTKKGDKMAFVKLENKTDEVEFIVFPSVFAEYGAKLEVDNVVKVSGRVNAKDRDGRITSEAKLLADSVELISDEVLDSYKSTGTKLAAPVVAPTIPRGRRGAKRSDDAISQAPLRVLKEPPKDRRKERLYILVENVDDVELLTAIRRLADLNSGFQEVVLVIRGEDGSKRPLRMPFKVDVSEDLLAKLRDLVGEDSVKVC